MVFLSSIGQDSHKFGDENKPLIMGGVEFENHQGFEANSDGDVILHALTNAISGITGRNILGKIADEMCQNGITGSKQYLQLALDDLQKMGGELKHIVIAMECLTPKISPKTDEIKNSIAKMLGLKSKNIGLTATTGEGLSDYGKGLGVFVNVIISVEI